MTTTIPPAQDFDTDVAVVTGAGSGIGRATAEYLALRGAAIVVNDLDAAAAHQSAATITSSGGRAIAVLGNVADPELAELLASTAVTQFGRLTVVVNSPGPASFGSLVELADEQIRSEIETRLFGTIWMTRAALGAMTNKVGGRIINTASATGAFGLAEASSTAAADAGIIGFTKATALELANSPIAINAITPVADTQHSNEFFTRNPQLNRRHYQVSHIPPVTAFLASKACKLNGELVSVAAGRVARIFSSTTSGHFQPAADHRDIEANITAIMSTRHPVTPQSALDEFLLIEV